MPWTRRESSEQNWLRVSVSNDFGQPHFGMLPFTRIFVVSSVASTIVDGLWCRKEIRGGGALDVDKKEGEAKR